MAADESEDPSFSYWRMTLRFGRMAMDTRLAWVRRDVGLVAGLGGRRGDVRNG